MFTDNSNEDQNNNSGGYEDALSKIFGSSEDFSAPLVQKIESEIEQRAENKIIEERNTDAFSNKTLEILGGRLDPADDPGPRTGDEFKAAIAQIKDKIRVINVLFTQSKMRFNKAKTDFDYFTKTTQEAKKGIFSEVPERKKLAALSALERKIIAGTDESGLMHGIRTIIRKKFDIYDDVYLQKMNNSSQSEGRLNRIISMKSETLEYLHINQQRVPLAYEVTKREFDELSAKLEQYKLILKDLEIRYNDFFQFNKLPELTEKQVRFLLVRDQNYEYINKLRNNGYIVDDFTDAGVAICGYSTMQHKPRHKDYYDLMQLQHDEDEKSDGFRDHFDNKDNHFKPAQHKMN